LLGDSDGAGIFFWQDDGNWSAVARQTPLAFSILPQARKVPPRFFSQDHDGTGCGAIPANQTRWTEQLLTTAGFQTEPVAKAEEIAHLRTLKPRNVVQDRRHGQISYV